ncbi:hypothetical protein Tco_0448675 [Tanacetum coccineum]
MVINSPCLTDKKELAIPGQTATGKEFSNPLMAGSLPKTISAKNTATSKTVNSVKQIHAIVDGKAVVISKSSVRNDLLFDDEDGITCLINDEIFKNLALMGQSKSFSGKVTLIFYSMLVQNHAPEGEGSAIPPEPQPTPSISPMMVQATEDMGADLATPTDSHFTPEKVLDLEKSKTAQVKEITSLKKRVKQLEKRRKSRPSRLRRLRKIGSSSRVESSNDASLGAQEDASKQGRKIEDLDADAEVTLVNETQEMNDDNLMFDTGVLEEQEIKFEKVVKEPVVSVATTTKSIPVSVAEVVTTASASVKIPDELTLAQTLIKIKTAKPKPVTTAATTVTSVRPRAKGIIFHDQEE